MPFKSKKQMRWMFATHPKMAKKWADHTPDAKDLPENDVSRKSHLRHLYELFFPEARFPDEKFWSRGGDPIHAPSKGPNGAKGLTMRDLGASDEPEDTEPPTAPKAAHGTLFNHFSKTFPEFIRNIDAAAKKLYGNDYQKTVDDFFKRPNYVRDLIKRLWDGNWTDSESLDEIGFVFDVVQSGVTGSGYYNPSHYKHISDPSHFHPKQDYDMNSGDMVDRLGRPKGVRKVKHGNHHYQDLIY